MGKGGGLEKQELPQRPTSEMRRGRRRGEQRDGKLELLLNNFDFLFRCWDAERGAGTMPRRLFPETRPERGQQR